MENDNKRILIIEDDEEMRSLLKDFFNEEGYEADSVDKGRYAFKKLMTESYDRIITDIRNPSRVEKASTRYSHHCHYGFWR
jgi:two-component system response regulator ResD